MLVTETCYLPKMQMTEICYLPKQEFPPCPKEISFEIYKAVVKSMLKKRLLKLTYIKESHELSKRKVIAEALVWRNGYWYLAAFCQLRGERRTFRVDRIIKAKKCDEKCRSTGIGKEVKKHGLFSNFE